LRSGAYSCTHLPINPFVEELLGFCRHGPAALVIGDVGYLAHSSFLGDLVLTDTTGRYGWWSLLHPTDVTYLPPNARNQRPA
jgi:hypothetical protein